MAKVWQYVWISTGLMLFLAFAGLPTGAESIFNLLSITFDGAGNIAGFNFSTSTFFNNLFKNVGTVLGSLIGIGIIGGAVVAGLLTRSKPENLITLTFITTVLILFVATGISIVTYSISLGTTWVAAIISFLFIPWTVGFITALQSYFKGTD